MPDLTITIPLWARVVHAECKRIDRSAGSARFHKAISKANSQIKARGTADYGIVYIDISDRVDAYDQTDATPQAVLDTVGIIEKLLRGEFFSAVGAVILLWERVIVRSNPSAGVNTLAVLIKQSIAVRHPKPTVPLPEDISSLLVVSSATTTIVPVRKRHAS